MGVSGWKYVSADEPAAGSSYSQIKKCCRFRPTLADRRGYPTAKKKRSLTEAPMNFPWRGPARALDSGEKGVLMTKRLPAEMRGA